MSCTVLVQSTTGSIVVYLTLSATGAAATGLTFSDVTAAIKKEGGSFVSKTLDGTNFTDLGGGFYQINLSTADTDTLGNLYLRITGATINTALASAFVAETAPTSTATALTIPQTTIFGYIYNAQGNSVSGASITARILASPTVITTGTEGLTISTELVTTKTGTDGMFTLNLATGTTVDLSIPAANYRRTFVVPSANTNIFDIP